MINTFCQLGTKCLIVIREPLILKTKQMRPIPRARASFILQILESFSKQSEFIMKQCYALMSMLNRGRR